MRGFAILAVLSLAGCEVATRNATDLEFLRDVEALIDAKDRCGLFRLVTAQPGATRGSDALAVELRDFVAASRGECRFGRTGPHEGSWTPLPDMDVIATARREDSGSSDAPSPPAAPSPAESRVDDVVADSGQDAPSGGPGSAGAGAVGPSLSDSGSSTSGNERDDGTRSSGRSDRGSDRDGSGGRGERGSGSRDRSKDDDKGRGGADKEGRRDDRDRERERSDKD